MIIEKAKRALAECPGWNSEDNLYLEADPEKCRAILILKKNRLLTAKVAYGLVGNLSSANIMVEVINKLSRCDEKYLRNAIIAAYISRHFAEAVVGLRSVQSIIELVQVLNELEKNRLVSPEVLDHLTNPFNQTVVKVKAILELSKQRHPLINYLNVTNLNAIFSVPEVSKAIFILMKYELIAPIVEEGISSHYNRYIWTDHINQPMVAKAVLALENNGLLHTNFWIFSILKDRKLAQAIVALDEAKLLNAKTLNYVQIGSYTFKNEYTSKDFIIRLYENNLLNPISLCLFNIASISDFAHGFIEAVSSSTQKINKQIILELWQPKNEIDRAIKELYRQDLIDEEKLSLLTQTRIEKTKLPSEKRDNVVSNITISRTARKESISFAREILGIFSKQGSDEVVPESDNEEKISVSDVSDVSESDAEESKSIVRKPKPSFFAEKLTNRQNKYQRDMKNSMLEMEQFQLSLKAYHRYREWGFRSWRAISTVSSQVISDMERARNASERYQIALRFVEAKETADKPYAKVLRSFVKRR